VTKGVRALLAAATLAGTVVVGCSGSKSAGGKSVAATMRAAGCSYRDAAPYPPKDAATDANYHNDVPTLTTKARWSTFPPSAGSHYRLWATWGFYRRPVNPRLVVHDEEHGGVVLWWGPQVAQSTVDELQRFYEQQPVGVFGTPIAGLGGKLALTAWTADPAWKGDPGLAYLHHHYGVGHVAVCPRFDAQAFATFRDAFRGKGPQGFPLSGDKPGCGPDNPCER
jgi:hypothetical protein